MGVAGAKCIASGISICSLAAIPDNTAPGSTIRSICKMHDFQRPVRID